MKILQIIVFIWNLLFFEELILLILYVTYLLHVFAFYAWQIINLQIMKCFFFNWNMITTNYECQIKITDDKGINE